MKVSCGKRALLDGLHKVSRVVSARSTLPILSNVLVEAAKGEMKLAAYDLAVATTTSVEAEVTRAGAITLPARLLVDIISALPDAEVILTGEPEKSQLTVECHRSRYVLNGLPAEEFPTIPALEDKGLVTMPQSLLKEMIQQTAFATSEEEMRPVMTGVLFLIEDKTLTLVATDTFRLAARTIDVECDSQARVRVVVPAKAMRELARLLGEEGDADISASSNQVQFVMPQATLISSLIEGMFPDHKAVIPSEWVNRVTAERVELEAALRRAQLVARENNNRVQLKVRSNAMDVVAVSSGVGEAREQVNIALEGEEVDITFNVRFLIEPLAVMESEQAVIEMRGSSNPALIRPAEGADYRYVIMPLHLGAEQY